VSDELFSHSFWVHRWEAFVAQASGAALGVLGTLILYGILRRLVREAIRAIVTPLALRVDRGTPESRAARAATLTSLLTSIANYVLLFVAGAMILNALGLAIMPIVASAGVAGLAVGFGAQKLVKDVITGFFILLEDQFSVGDTITAAGSTGVVEEMGMRITRLRDEVGKLIILSNGDISTVVNHSRGPMLVSVDVSVAPTTDLEALRGLVQQAGEELRARDGLLAEAPVVRGVVTFDSTKITVRVSARAQPGHQQDAELALRQALREKLLAAGVALV
jgi:moderate conductance mechanosensitive channel